MKLRLDCWQHGGGALNIEMVKKKKRWKVFGGVPCTWACGDVGIRMRVRGRGLIVGSGEYIQRCLSG